jgi:hypothetical protein
MGTQKAFTIGPRPASASHAAAAPVADGTATSSATGWHECFALALLKLVSSGGPPLLALALSKMVSSGGPPLTA